MEMAEPNIRLSLFIQTDHEQEGATDCFAQKLPVKFLAVPWHRLSFTMPGGENNGYKLFHFKVFLGFSHQCKLGAGGRPVF